MTACEVWFYQMEDDRLDKVLPSLLEKTLARGWKALVCSPMAKRLEELDDHLWMYRKEAFLPHALSTAPGAENQTVLLSGSPDNLNRADALFLLDGADLPELEGYARCIILFNGRAEDSRNRARQQWAQLKTSGLSRSHWTQTGGRWEKQA